MKKSTILLISVAVLLIIYLLFRAWTGGATPTPAEQQTKVMGPYGSWMTYEAPSKLFSASFPAKPEYGTNLTRDDLGITTRTNEMYGAEDKDSSVYLVSVVRYFTHGDSLPLADEQMMSNVMYDTLDSEKGNQLVGFRKEQLAGRPALAFTIQNGSVTMEVITLTNKNDLIILTYVSDAANYKFDNFQHFINSFKLGDVN